MIACTVGARSKNSNLSHHQQRGIVTTSSPSILWDVSQIIFCDFVFKIKFNIFLISKLMDTFPELANSCVKFKIRFVERSMEAWWLVAGLALNYAKEGGLALNVVTLVTMLVIESVSYEEKRGTLWP